MDDNDSRIKKRRQPQSSHDAKKDHSSKRSRPDGRPQLIASDTDNTERRYSVESLLSVPLEVVFREIGDGNTQTAQSACQATRKPWLTRAEAQCLLRVSMLAHELDVLTRLSEDALARRQWGQSFCRKVLHTEPRKEKESAKVLVHPFLRPIVPILAVHDQFSSQGCLRYIQMQLDRVVLGLRMCAGTLRNFSEQNFTYADNLLDALGDGIASPTNTHNPGRVLEREKRKLAELEEELCRRVESILLDSTSVSSNDIESAEARRVSVDRSNLAHVTIEPMSAICAKILGLSSSVPWAVLPKALQQQGHPTTREIKSTPKKIAGDDVALSASQNSYVRRSNAAEALAVLAFGCTS